MRVAYFSSQILLCKRSFFAQQTLTAPYADPANKAVFQSLDLPDAKLDEPVRYSGTVAVPAHDFAQDFSNFAFASFLTREEVVYVLARVREECNNQLPVRLFNTSVKRSLQLEEFGGFFCISFLNGAHAYSYIFFLVPTLTNLDQRLHAKPRE